MPYVTDTLASLNGGVSQRPARQRLPGKAAELVNAWLTFAGGAQKRPPLQNIAQLSASSEGYLGGMVETIDWGNDRRFQIVIANGNLRVFDESGQEQDVFFPDGVEYLGEGGIFRALAVQGSIWILNRTREIRRLQERTPAPDPAALVYIRQADFGTTYQLRIDDTPIEHATPDAFNPHDRQELDTGEIAEALAQAVRDGTTGFLVDVFGSTIHIRRSNGQTFDISGSDGLADRGMVVVHHSVQRFEDLPLKAPDGFVCEVTGDPGSEDDNYWVRFDDQGTPEKGGVWREIAQPGTRDKLDPESMPHQLIFQGPFAEGEALAVPPAPEVGVEGRNGEEPGWSALDLLGDSDWASIDPNRDATFSRHGSGVRRLLITAFQGQRVVTQAGFGVDTTRLPPGETITVTLRSLSTGLSVSRTYGAGQVLHGETLEIEYAAFGDTNESAELKLEYGSGDNPTDTFSGSVDPSRTARVTAYGIDTMAAHPSRLTLLRYRYRWNNIVLPDRAYPEGWEIEAVVGGNTFSYTTSGQETAAQVASGLAAVINAHGDFNANSVGNPRRVRIQTSASQVATTVTAGPTWAPSTHAAVQLGDPVDTHVGRTVRNLTDGSSGTVVASGPQLIEVSSLTGGVRNEFRKGDLIEIVGAGDYFIFREAPWKPREAGRERFPSFVGWPAREIFYFEGRLGLTAADSVVLSRAGDQLDFFRKSARLLRDDDVIDVASAGRRVAEFHTAMEWDTGLYLKSDRALYRLFGEPLLSPRTVSLQFVAEMPNDPDVRPVVAGSRIFFVRTGPKGAQVLEASVRDNLRVEADNIAAEIPSYIGGTPLELAADDALGVLFVLTDEALYAYTYLDDPRHGRIHSAWSRWGLPPEPIALSMAKGVLAVVTVRDSGVYLGEIDLTGDPPLGKGDYVDEVDQAFPYGLLKTFSPIFPRGDRGAVVPGDLRIQYVELHYHNTTDLTVTVQPAGRAAKSYTVDHEVAQDGSIRVPLGAKDFTLTLASSEPGPCAVSTLDWEGTFVPRQFTTPRQES